jgi:hypothetical protein
MCHCLECQRRTGSAFSVAVFYERSSVRVARGTSDVFERGSASGFPVRFHFCGRCGSNVYWEPARLPDLVGVAVGAFGDASFPQPEQVGPTQRGGPGGASSKGVSIEGVSPLAGPHIRAHRAVDRSAFLRAVRG